MIAMKNPKISILMSIYNESELQIRESIDSMLSQTFENFELVIISDNPQRTDIKPLLDRYNDSRIIFLQNESNLGLAMSMNRAASIASADVYARMDADDVSVADRLEKSIKYLDTGKYDFVFSQYYCIDNESKIIDVPLQDIVKDEEALQAISLDPSLIHHPTVIFTKVIFEKTGGYRNFPCSQDADLWLRMCEVGCRFHMIDQPLIYYRVNPNSISSKKWFKQQLTCNYIFELSLQRLYTGKDSFSREDYENYLNKWGLDQVYAERKLKACYHTLDKAGMESRNGDLIKSFILRFSVFLKSGILRRHYLKLKEKDNLLKKIKRKKI